MRVIAFVVACVFSYVLITSCWKDVNPAKLDEVKTAYIEQNLPQIKVVREQAVYQINTCNKNIETLEKLKSSFEKQESKAFVQKKIEQIAKQCNELKEHVNKIDTEVEKGLALQAFNSIDGGGIRHEEILQIADEARVSINNAQKANSNIANEYGIKVEEQLPPKAIPVEIPKQENKPSVAVEPRPSIGVRLQEQVVSVEIVPKPRKSLRYALPDLYEARNVYIQQLQDAYRRGDTFKIRVNQEQIRIIDNKIADIQSER
jgi:hypothetical protein